MYIQSPRTLGFTALKIQLKIQIISESCLSIRMLMYILFELY